MELREALGRRRSIRFIKPYKPVEPEKIQVMFEAARIASHWGNVQSLRGIAIFRDSASKELLDQLEGIIVGWQIRKAPCVIVWYLDPSAVDGQGDRLRKLAEVGALGVGDKQARADGIDNTLLPIFSNITDALKAPGMSEIDCGQGIAQATLAAFEMGLGTCCLGAGPGGAKLLESLEVPEGCRMLLLQTVGYPLEHWEAGGQRPRLPFGELFHMNKYGESFPRNEEVVEELERDGMFTRPAPLPDREEELEFLKNALGLKAPAVL
ncbi:MAG: nitroreductase family protein [Pseudomonadales bacterium]